MAVTRRARAVALGCRLAVFALVAVLSATQAAAQASHDSQLWTQVVVTAPVAPDWLVHLEGQPRWSDDVSALNQVIARVALGRRVTSRVTLWGGYARIPRTLGPGTQHEQRAWQQLSATFPTAKGWASSLRLRVEQRFLESWADNSHRVRIMGRLVRPLDRNGSWNLAVSNETMVIVDDTAAGPWQGFDQNRLFAGVMRRLTSEATLEGGYLWQTMKRPANAHVVLVWLNVVL